MPSERYGKMREGTQQIIVQSALLARRNALWARLVPHVVPMFKDGSRLPPIEAGWLQEWMGANGHDGLAPADFQVVQISRAEAAALLGGGDREAERSIRGLEQIGLLQVIHKGVKGHSTLYVVRPLPPSGLSPPE